MEENAKTVAQLLKLLANEHRLLILCALAEGERTVGEIHAFLPGITGSALSQHLSQLKLGGILEAEKRGMHVFYRIDDPRVVSLLGVLKEYYCP
ncbi:ArsR/SmtB family transcription factor [Candidatus Pseudoscillospira sp. SGI.172]|uniref:ArsR/SmtB family transcription factor n=1 Tax=Candidatus Pseudoscillospira sp. SGI.172 TaxID=3420582 RepID=UPI0009BB81E2|nr:metalloregulator ArsR/SmtB family transcription factor [Pseudoflavonifractor sp.]MDY3019357.1 metalloregulator ArsR/SmtB family transcription factor [Oscillospiraceae bacterium]